MIAIYLIAIYLGQIGYCVLLVIARKPETKVSSMLVCHSENTPYVEHQNTLVKGVGLPLVFANFVMAFWAIAWVRPARHALWRRSPAVTVAFPSVPPLHNIAGNTASSAHLR